MAVSNSVAIGAGRKSVGEITYRRVRGRTIVSQRVTTNGSKSKLQTRARFAFKYLIGIQSELSGVIDATFNPTKLGSRKNAFFKANEAVRLFGTLTNVSEHSEGIIQAGGNYLAVHMDLSANPLESEFESTPPIVLGSGGLGAVVEFGATGTLLTPRVSLSRAFRADDVINVIVTKSYKIGDVPVCLTNIIPYVVPSDIEDGTSVLTLDNDVLPRLGTALDAPAGAIFALSAVVRSGSLTSKAQHLYMDVATLPAAFSGDAPVGGGGTDEPGDI